MNRLGPDGGEVAVTDIQRAMLEASRHRPGFVDDAKSNDWKSKATPKHILCLDVSSSCGWAKFIEGEKMPVKYGRIESVTGVLSPTGTALYPFWLLNNVLAMKEKIRKVVEECGPDIVVIEETNLGKSRYAQKFLEWLHFNLIAYFHVAITQRGWPQEVVYINSREWRRALGLKLTKEDAKMNKKVRDIKRSTFLNAEAKAVGLAALRAQGVRGVKNKKHLALDFVERTYGLKLAVKDNDIADAICLGAAYIAGAAHVTGLEKG